MMMEQRDVHFTRCKLEIKTSKIFRTMTDAAVSEIVGASSRVSWSEKTFVNSDSFIDSHFYCLLSGRVKMYQIHPDTGRNYTIDILKKGDCFDIMSLFDIKEHHVYFETIDEVELLSIPMISLKAWIAKYPEFYISLSSMVAERICLLEEIATEMCLTNTLSRLAHLLLRNIDEDSCSLKVIDNLSNEELASLLGTTRAVVNRNIQELKDKGAITVARKHIEITNKETLTSLSGALYMV